VVEPNVERSGEEVPETFVTHHRYAVVGDYRLFYREAGSVRASKIVLLHGFPTSSFMFRDLIPALADRYHVIAPDHLGFGLSDAPPVERFTYTFDALADLTSALLKKLGVERFAMYVQHYGASVGWRLALGNPDAVSAIITQNGNAYEVGFVDDFWEPIRDYWRDENLDNEAALRQVLTLDAIRWQYLNGTADPTVVSPDTWIHDYALVSRPGNDLIQIQLFANYATDLAIYPRLHSYLQERTVPVLAVWGRNDGIYRPAGALAYAQHAPTAEIHLLDGGHFLLESHLAAVVAHIYDFLERNLP
jgi:pimeloyl-ACP methyl ester carboxylesterase